MEDRERYAKGMEVRRTVLGDAHVDLAARNTNAFNQEFQDLITRYAWGEIWARPGLSRHTRSLIVIATMVALNRPEELRMHLAWRWFTGLGSIRRFPTTRRFPRTGTDGFRNRSCSRSCFRRSCGGALRWDWSRASICRWMAASWKRMRPRRAAFLGSS